MPTCPRCALVATALAFLAFSGCDTNNPGRELESIEGRYAVAEIRFDPQATALDDVDVASTLNLNETRLRIFGNDEESIFEVQPSDGGSLRIDLQTSASRGRVTFEATDQADIDDLAELLLPPDFTLEYDGDRPSVLSNTISRQNVDLEAFDPDRYQGLRNTSGQLTIRLERL